MICPYTISSDFSDQVLPACSCLGSMPAATNYTQKLWTCGDLLTTGSDLDRDSPCRADYTDQSPMEPLYACFEEKKLFMLVRCWAPQALANPQTQTRSNTKTYHIVV